MTVKTDNEAPLFQLIEQMAPHNVLARLQNALAQQQAVPLPAPWVQTTEHQQTNIGLYKQEQYVGERKRVGRNVEAEGGYMTGIGDIAEGSCPVPATSLAQQPVRQPSTIGLAGQVATNPKGIETEEKYPVKEAERKYVGYAPVY